VLTPKVPGAVGCQLSHPVRLLLMLLTHSIETGSRVTDIRYFLFLKLRQAIETAAQLANWQWLWEYGT